MVYSDSSQFPEQSDSEKNKPPRKVQKRHIGGKGKNVLAKTPLSKAEKLKAAYLKEKRRERKAGAAHKKRVRNDSDSDDVEPGFVLKKLSKKRRFESDSELEEPSKLNGDKNKSTSARGFQLSSKTLKAKAKKRQLSEMTELLKKDNWPLEPFAEIRDAKRGSWVRWAKRFKAVCSLVPGLTEKQARTMLLLKGGGKIYDVVGDDIYEMGLKKIWKRLDGHYAAMGDPDTELMIYHSLRQSEGEDFSDFVDRLKEQAVRAELSREKEADELRAALVERSLVATKLAYEAKTRNISNNELIRRGVDLCKRFEQKKLAIQQIEQQRTLQPAVGQQQTPNQIHVVSKTGVLGKRKWNDDQQQKTNKACRSCGKQHFGKCNAKQNEKLCWKCNKPGHFAVSCGATSGAPQSKQIYQVNHRVADNGWDD